MKSKLAWTAFGVTLMISLGIRFCELSAGQTWNGLSTALCIVLAAGFMVCFFASRRDHTMVRLPLNGRVLSIAYMITGVMLSAISVVFQAKNRTGRFPYLSGICTILAVCAGLILCLQGSLFIANGQNYAARHQALALLPSVWCCCALVLQFHVNTEEVANTADILRTGALIFLLLTLLSLAQMAAEVKRVSRGRLFGLGLPFVIFVVVSALPQTAGIAIVYPNGMQWVLLVFAAFVMFSLLTVRPMTREELTGETEDMEEPEVRPVVMKDNPSLRLQHFLSKRPIVASRENPRPLSQNEVDKRLERILVQYLGQSFKAKCYFYRRRNR